MSSSTFACVVVSRAVVGSSATRRAGRLRTPMAIRIRCFMPPENSCGYLPSWPRRAPEYRRDAIPRRCAPPHPRVGGPDALSSASCNCHPIVRTGFRADPGFWGISAIRSPRSSRRISFLLQVEEVAPLERHAPGDDPPGRGRRPQQRHDGGRLAGPRLADQSQATRPARGRKRSARRRAPTPVGRKKRLVRILTERSNGFERMRRARSTLAWP